MYLGVRGDESPECVHKVRRARQSEARGDHRLHERCQGAFRGEGTDVVDQVLGVRDGGFDRCFAVVGRAVAVHVAFPDEGALA